MPMSTIVGIVPAMFQVPISAPTASRMKMAPTAEVTPPTAASATPATVKPFLKAIRLANAALSSSATCSGPSVAPMPKSTIVVASSEIRTTMGSSASSSVGARGAPATGDPSSTGSDVTGGLAMATSAEKLRQRGLRSDVLAPVMLMASRDEDEPADQDQQDRREGPARHVCLHDRSHRVANKGAGHAVAPAAALPELEALDGDDLNTGLTHLGDRVCVPLVGDHHTGLEGDHVVAVVPLFALLLVDVTTGLHHLHLRHLHGVRDRGQEVLLLGHVEGARLVARPEADRPGVVHDPRVERDLVAVQHREDGVEVHVRAVLGHQHGHHPLGGSLGEHRPCHLLDHPSLGPLTESDQHGAVADGLHVTALEGRPAEVLGVEAALVT